MEVSTLNPTFLKFLIEFCSFEKVYSLLKIETEYEMKWLNSCFQMLESSWVKMSSVSDGIISVISIDDLIAS